MPLFYFLFYCKSDTYGNKFGSPGNSKEVPYDCIVDPPFVGYVSYLFSLAAYLVNYFSSAKILFHVWAWRYAKPRMDLDTGSTYCLFFPYSPEHLVHSMPKSKEMRPDISVSINASMREANHVSGSSSALFIGGFSVLEMGEVMILSWLAFYIFTSGITKYEREILIHHVSLQMTSALSWLCNFGTGGQIARLYPR